MFNPSDPKLEEIKRREEAKTSGGEIAPTKAPPAEDAHKDDTHAEEASVRDASEISGQFLSTLRPAESHASSHGAGSWQPADSFESGAEASIAAEAGKTEYEPPAAGLQDTHEACVVVGEGVKIVGQIRDCRLMQIYGTVDGDLEVEELIVHGSGLLKGNVKADRAEVHGAVDGELSVKHLLDVKATGSVAGTTEYGALSIETGGRVIGTLDDGSAKNPGPAGVSALAPATNRSFTERDTAEA